MGSLSILERLADPYERPARLYPALLAIAPVFAVLVGLYGVPLEIKSGLISLAAGFGLFYLLASIARELGKRRENGLFVAWGGKPTTQMLRHRDTTIDPVTKARYHSFLGKRLGVAFPTGERELGDPGAADEVYASGARWLLDRTRDTHKFPLLFKENVAYGFRRNCLGLKPLAVVIACGSILWVLLALNVVTARGIHAEGLLALPASARATIAVSVVLLIVWVLFVTKRTVRTAAFMYADLLLRACDVLNQKK
jgi:hypothetical protein